MSIFLVRHGETDSNAARVVQLPDAPLSERGRAQALRVGLRLSGLGIGGIVSSDYPRARDTAEPLRVKSGAPLELMPELRERNLGDLRGRPYADFDFDIFAPEYAPPSGETWKAFHARVDIAWEKVRARATSIAGNLAVVTHGLVIRSIFDRWLDRANHSAPLLWPNASLTIVNDAPPHGIELLCCVEHLSDLRPAATTIA